MVPALRYGSCIAAASLASGTALAQAPTGTPSGHGGANLPCTDSLKTRFKPDAQTRVTMVKLFRKGDPLEIRTEG
jgi:hypothetical protein